MAVGAWMGTGRVCVCVCVRARAHPCYAPRFDGDVSVSNSPLLN